MKKESRNKARLKKHLKIRQKINGTSLKPRLSIYKSHQNFYAQLIDDSKGITLASASTVNDKNYSGNIEAAKKLGHTFGKKIKELHFFYDRNQDFREDYTIKGTKSGSIQELENRDGVFK